jgi:RNA polymerase sigma factor (sigma-70 family)
MSLTVTNDQSDLVLLRSYAQGRDAEAFAELVRRHAGLVFTVARRLTGNAQDAEDIAQTCFMEMARKAPDISISPAGWLHRAATCRSLDAVRADLSRRQREAQAAAAARQHADPKWEELAAFIDEVIDKLPEELRAPLVLHYLEGRTQGDVGRELGVDQSTISRRLEQGVEKLRERLAKAGVVASVAGLTAMLAAHPAEAAPPALIAATGKMAVAGVGNPAAMPRLFLWKAIIGGTAAILLLALTSYLIYDVMTNKPPGRVETVPLRPAAKTISATKSRTIPGVRTLGWNQEQENTFAGSLQAALAVTPHPVDYQTIMGVSGLAFRIRWFERKPGGTWDGSAPVGTMPHPLEEIRRGTGWTLRIVWIPPAKNPMPDEYMPQIIASIDAGIPVVGYEPKLNSGVIYGYDDYGQTLLLNDYYIGGGGSRYSVEQVPVNFVIPVSWWQPQPPRESALEAVKLAVRNWHRMHESIGPTFRYWHGKTAYEKWTADVETANALPAKEFASLFFVHWWNFTSLIDARAAGASYLRAQKGHFKTETAAHFEKAAEHYDEMARLGKEAIAGKKIFLGRWTGKSPAEWTEAVQAEEREFLARLRGLDESAISELEEALSLEGVDTQTLRGPAVDLR